LIERHASRPSQVTTVMIQNADHMYSGQEEQVADVIAGWIAALEMIRAGASRTYRHRVVLLLRCWSRPRPQPCTVARRVVISCHDAHEELQV
jgi:hypothetical protein